VKYPMATRAATGYWPEFI